MEGFRNMTPRIALCWIGVEVPLKVGIEFKKSLEILEMENYFRIRTEVAEEFECPITAEDSQKCAAITKLAATDGASHCIALAEVEDRSINLIYTFQSYELFEKFKKDFDERK